jgi:MFS family permease
MNGHNVAPDKRPRVSFFYGWVIVGASMLILAMHAGTMYGFGVFFKPMANEFGWARGATAGVYATFSVVHGIFVLPMGLLADKYGPSKLMAFCGAIVGLGLVLSSQVNALWQMYVTFGVIVGIGLGGPFAIAVSTTARWFVKRRGLALGLVSSGVGLGTLALVPLLDRLITSYSWSTAYLVLGTASGVVMIAGAMCLRKDPQSMGLEPYGSEPSQHGSATRPPDASGPVAQERSISLLEAVRTRTLWLMVGSYTFFNFCLQMVMVHLVNYATDIGITPLVAATFISVIGVGSVTGRVAMGAISDRLGSHNALLICCLILASTLILLIFARSPWTFYLFAVTFGFAYGGEVPQMAALVGRFFGLRAVAALVGAIALGATTGGALGSYLAGYIFDVTDSYRLAFFIAASVSSIAVITTIGIGRQWRRLGA